MDKVELLERVKGTHTREQLIGWVNGLPHSMVDRRPSVIKVGDVFRHPIFKHPYVLLKKKEDYWICGLLTTETTCDGILEECQSRFFKDGLFTRTLFATREIHGYFINTYANSKHLNEIYIKLIKCL